MVGWQTYPFSGDSSRTLLSLNNLPLAIQSIERHVFLLLWSLFVILRKWQISWLCRHSHPNRVHQGFRLKRDERSDMIISGSLLTTFEAIRILKITGTVAKIGLSLKSSHQIYLILSKSLIHTVVPLFYSFFFTKCFILFRKCYQIHFIGSSCFSSM